MNASIKEVGSLAIDPSEKEPDPLALQQRLIKEACQHFRPDIVDGYSYESDSIE